MSATLPELQEALENGLRELHRGHDSLATALGLEPDDVTALAAYGRELIEHGQLDTAQAVFAGLTLIEPGNAMLHTLLGILHRRRGQLRDAYEELILAAKLDGDDGLTAIHLGELQLDRGELDAATLTLARAQQLENLPKPLRHRAGLLLEIAHLSARELRAKGPQRIEEIRRRRHRLEGERRRLPILALPAPRVGGLRDQRLSSLLSSA